ncbi:hypothetical protein DS885_03920 [Psychromonas sp. B3M02]|uniref:hypothetical protein n=1 Tax=Psychromonas sp. B3M02 TaxID=2267226 RepID=UPI000DE9F768|nr:hypothetical protein [Psychromonas sp. B3M02]RBW47304.1 hypothetical protein DS885_03920 [Psychromonas sp. B3M02]
MNLELLLSFIISIFWFVFYFCNPKNILNRDIFTKNICMGIAAAFLLRSVGSLIGLKAITILSSIIMFYIFYCMFKKYRTNILSKNGL